MNAATMQYGAGCRGGERDGSPLAVHPWRQARRSSALAPSTCAILFLASDEARYVTGTELKIDAGYTVR